jgi:hypothetical protein
VLASLAELAELAELAGQEEGDQNT